MKQHLLTKVDIDAETQSHNKQRLSAFLLYGFCALYTVGLLWGLKALVDFLCSLG